MESRLGTILESLVSLAIRNYFSLAHSLKPCGKWKKNISISEGTLLIQTSCKWARKVHTITKTRPKTKTRGKKKHTSLGLEKEGRASKTRGATLPPSGTTGSSHPLPCKPASTVRVLWEDLKRQEDSSPGPSPPLRMREQRGGCGPYAKPPHVTDTQWTRRTGIKTKGPTDLNDAYRFQLLTLSVKISQWHIYSWKFAMDNIK